MQRFYSNTLDDEVFHIILSTCRSATLDGLGDILRFRQRARTIGANIYDMTVIHSGLISAGYVLSKKEGGKKGFTREHFHGRQECGEILMSYTRQFLLGGIEFDIDYVKSVVDKHRQVHYTTAEENQALRDLSDAYPELKKDWQKMYDLCNIKLIPYVKGQRYEKYQLPD